MTRVPAFGFALVATVAFAEPEPTKFEMTRLDIDAPDGRVVATSKGFIALERGKDGDRIVHWDREGKELAELARSKNRFECWWAAPEGNALAYVGTDDKLTVKMPGVDVPETEAYFDGAVSFSPDGRRVAFRTTKSIIVREVVKGGSRVEIPASEVSEGPFWTGDGKSLVTVTGQLKIVNGITESSPDTVKCCDPGAERPEWKEIVRARGATISCLATDSSGRRVAFLETKDDRAKVRLFDLDKGELRVFHGMQLTRSISFTPGGDLLSTYSRSEGRSGALLIGTVDFELRPIAEVGGSDSTNEEIRSAVAAGRDTWFVMKSARKEAPQVVRVTRRP